MICVGHSVFKTKKKNNDKKNTGGFLSRIIGKVKGKGGRSRLYHTIKGELKMKAHSESPIKGDNGKDLLAFDINSTDKLMPFSGTYINVAEREYLLFNNTRYNQNSDPAQKEYHFPVKLKLTSTNLELLEDNTLVETLIDQVYQFSRMYWKSVSQQNLPVTTKYPEMVAEIFPHFEHNNLPEFGKENLWFL